MTLEDITPDVPLAPRVRTLATVRTGGVSTNGYASLNLALHVGDAPEAVARNRRYLRNALALPWEPLWMSQVHGTRVIHAKEAPVNNDVPVADAAVTKVPGQVLAVLTADCLPVVVAARDGRAVGVAHAGWRGIAAGVLEAAVNAMGVPAGDLAAWIGPAISAACYEVDGTVRTAFADVPGAGWFFTPARDEGHWYCDLPALAEARLRDLGVGSVEQSGLCTYSEPDRFYSYRRDGETGRFATLAWIVP